MSKACLSFIAPLNDGSARPRQGLLRYEQYCGCAVLIELTLYGRRHRPVALLLTGALLKTPV